MRPRRLSLLFLIPAAVAQFRAETAAVGDSADVDGWSQAGWITLDPLQTAAAGLTTVNFTKPAPDPALPRLFNEWSTHLTRAGVGAAHTWR